MNSLSYRYSGIRTTVGIWMSSQNSLIFGMGWDLIDFLLFDPYNTKNITLIWSSLSAEDRESWRVKYDQLSPASNEDDFRDLPLESGTLLYIDKQYINKLVSVSQSPNVEIVDPSNKPPFVVEALRELIESPKYVQRYDNSEIIQTEPRVKVWIWSRALSSQTGSNDLIDVSDYIESLDTSVSNGGTWNITLSAAGARYIKSLENNGKWSLVENEGKVFESSINISKSERSIFFFNIALQKNDLVFIQFEPLEEEDEEPLSDEGFVSNLDLPNRIYDMIGIVGLMNIMTTPMNGDVNIRLSGGDLAMILNTDTFYYYPEQFALKQMFWNGLDEKGLQRIGNQLVGISSQLYRRLGTLARFVLSTLSQMSLHPGQLFNPYGDEKTKWFDPDNQDKEAQGIYQIIKLIIDEDIYNRAIIDSSLGVSSGSISSFLNGLISIPFVELITDTYKDQFYITFRQCPWDFKGYSELAELCEESLTIKNEDVLSELINWNTEEIYSWYRLMPKAVTVGTADQNIWQYFKAIRFPEYAEIFGDKVLEITSNYLNFNEDQFDDSQIDQALLDLKFMVDCYSPLPFTRRGTITIRGDRRYKKGTILYFEPTDEYFLIDSVTQNYKNDRGGVERTSTLNVSRGMVKKYLPWYWLIIDTSIESSSQNQGSVEWLKNKIGQWKVNPDVFKFFIERRQFSDDELPANILDDKFQLKWSDPEIPR